MNPWIDILLVMLIFSKMSSWMKMGIGGWLCAVVVSRLCFLRIWGWAWQQWVSSQFCTNVVGSPEKETGIARDQCLGLLVHISGRGVGDKVWLLLLFCDARQMYVFNSWLKSYDDTRNLVMLNPVLASFPSRNSCP